MYRRRIIVPLVFLIVVLSLTACAVTYLISSASAVGASAPRRAAVSLVSVTATPSPTCGLAWNAISGEVDGNYMYAISAVSANDVWVVGSQSASEQEGVVTHWDGQTWAIVATPNFTSTTQFADVLALSPSNVWVIGYTDNHTLIMHWNGQAWTVMSEAASQSGAVFGHRCCSRR